LLLPDPEVEPEATPGFDPELEPGFPEFDPFPLLEKPLSPKLFPVM
jgi:hypothetical protein